MGLSGFLAPAWKRRCCKRYNERRPTLDAEGLVLGRTLLAKWIDGALAINEVRVKSLLFVAYQRPIAADVISKIRSAEKAYKRGDIVIALLHLAHTGLHMIDEFDTPLRLFKAEMLLRRGFTAKELLKAAGLAKDDSSDDEDDDEEEDGSEEGDAGSGGDNSGDSSDISDNSDFNSKHPRWPAGSPGGIGGEFAPKDGTDISLGRAPSDDSIDSDPIGGILLPAVVAAGALEFGGMEALISLGSGIRSAIEALSSDSSGMGSLPKPDGIPDDWIVKDADTSGGKIYTSPDNPNNTVRVMPADPNSQYPWQQVPYVIDQNGGYLDVNGNPIPGVRPLKTPDAHIPLTQYKFRR